MGLFNGGKHSTYVHLNLNNYTRVIMTKWALNMLEIACVCRTGGRQRGKNVVFNKSKPEAKNRVWSITILIRFCCVIFRALNIAIDQWSSSSAGKEDILEWVGPRSRSWPSLEFLQLLMDQLPATLLRCHHYSLHHHHHRNFQSQQIWQLFKSLNSDVSNEKSWSRYCLNLNFLTVVSSCD